MSFRAHGDIPCDIMDNRLNDDSTHVFAWDGFSFQTPQDWNLSEYSLQRDVSQVRMEDDNAVRLEMEWTRSRRPLEVERIRKRFAVVAKSLTSVGADTSPVKELPAGWSAFLYSMSDGRHLLAAFRLIPDSGFFCLFKLHFKSASRREPPRLIRLIASTFQINEEVVISWELFDIGLRLNREYRLCATSFQAGRQMMIFEWRRRRLHLWFFSLADLMLKGKSVAAWCVDFLDGFKGIPGPQFRVDAQPGLILAQRRWRYPLGHIEEIVRWCFRYQVRCVPLATKNQIVLSVFQYRTDADLKHLALDVYPPT